MAPERSSKSAALVRTGITKLSRKKSLSESLAACRKSNQKLRSQIQELIRNHYSGNVHKGRKLQFEHIKRDFARGYSEFSGAYGTSDNVHPLTKKKDRCNHENCA